MLPQYARMFAARALINASIAVNKPKTTIKKYPSFGRYTEYQEQTSVSFPYYQGMSMAA